MRDDSNLIEPLLADGDHSKLIPVQRASYWEKLCRILPQSPGASWLDFEKNINHGVCGFSHKSTMTEVTRSPVQRRTWISILVLILLFLLIIMGILFFYNSALWWQQSLVEVDRIRVGENITAPILVPPKNLTVAALLEAKMQEPHRGAMRSCLDESIREFFLEPDMVKKNAWLILQCNGTRQEFLSGKGENHIQVLWLDGKARYVFDESNSGVHVARIGRHTLPLNLTSILGVLRDLSSHNGSKELQNCLSWTLQEFAQEPASLQDNAKLVVSCGGRNLSFVSGEGQNEINVYTDHAEGEIQFQVKATGWAWWSRLFTRWRLS
ncbi:uncharacterized protein LOC123034451 [Varanus komodoensis]|uniref:uncharacterized protein LOC123034451 n=1 Tax=Varanus komodoensis TaxID=61221 RepID=UPI001CF7C47E|nr:uncharacterized protein LOC123034451 [Varanus komodoensis]